MTDLSTLEQQPTIIVIGLGVVGAALADELTARGMRHVTVVEQGPLYVTGGSSSHAPGFVFQTSGNRVMSTLAKRTLDKLDGLEHDGQFLLKRIGGLEIATTPERLTELKRRHGFASSWGIPSRLISPAECGEMWPGLDTSLILGALHTPTDGIVKSVAAVQYQAERALERGAKIIGHTRVTDIVRENGKVTGVNVVKVPSEGAEPAFMAADLVVSCAGLWGPGVARDMLGFDLPMVPMEHGFGFTEPLPQLQGTNQVLNEASRPMLRHQDHAMYLREFVDRIGIGAYEHRPMPLNPEQIASADEFAATGVHPAIHPFTEADFAPTWAEAKRLLPELEDAQLGETYNGIFSFTPDGGPMLGPVDGIAGLWLAQAVWVTQSAGVAQVVADWIVHNEPGIDTSGLDYRRFDPTVVSKQWAVARASESYDEVYDIVHPQKPTLQLRGLRTSPFYPRHVELGATFEEYKGWERPTWFAANEPLVHSLESAPQRDAWSGAVWSPIAAAEAHATRNAVALYDMSQLSRVEVSGPGASDFLQPLVSRNVKRTLGSVVYCLMLSEAGGILSDITVARLGDERYMIGTNGNLDLVHLRALRDANPAAAHVQIRDLTPGECGLGLWGPHARDVLAKLTSDDISHEGLKYFRCAEIRVAGAPVLALRVSYVGELGWELYTTADHGLYLWDQLWAAGQEFGIVAAGRRAFSSLRLEKGYRSFGGDMTREDTAEEAGLAFAVHLPKEGFVGRDALETRPVRRRLVAVTLDDPAAVVMGSEPAYRRGTSEVVGYVTSADQGYTIGRAIAFVWLPTDLAAVGSEIDLEYFGARLPATVQAEPLFDPEMAHIQR